jgi:hypothetical protein
MGHSLWSDRSTPARDAGTTIARGSDVESEDARNVDAVSVEEEDDSLSWFVNLLLAEVNGDDGDTNA